MFMEKLKEKLKMSYFIANKIYLFLIFIFLAIEDLTLGFYYFFYYLLSYILGKL